MTRPSFKCWNCNTIIFVDEISIIKRATPTNKFSLKDGAMYCCQKCDTYHRWPFEQIEEWFGKVGRWEKFWEPVVFKSIAEMTTESFLQEEAKIQAQKNANTWS